MNGAEYRRIKRICKSINRHADAILLTRRVFDNKGRRASRPGNNQATLWEIRSVWKLRTGETLGNISRQNYKTTVAPDGSITVSEKGKENPRMYSASVQELNNLETQETGRCTAKVGLPTPVNVTPNSRQYNQQIIAQDNSKLLNSFHTLDRIVKLIASITSTLSIIKIGPAVDTIKEASKYTKELASKIKEIINKLQRAYDKRT